MSKWCEMAEDVARKHLLQDYCIYTYRKDSLFTVVLQWKDVNSGRLGSIMQSAVCNDDAELDEQLKWKQLDLDFELKRALDEHWATTVEFIGNSNPMWKGSGEIS